MDIIHKLPLQCLTREVYCYAVPSVYKLSSLGETSPLCLSQIYIFQITAIKCTNLEVTSSGISIKPPSDLLHIKSHTNSPRRILFVLLYPWSGTSETSVTNYQWTLRNIAEERRSDLVLIRTAAECAARGLSGQGKFMSVRVVATRSARGEWKHAMVGVEMVIGWIRSHAKSNYTTWQRGHVLAQSILNAMLLK